MTIDYKYLTLNELQHYASLGITEAVYQLGLAVVDYDFNSYLDRDATVIFLENEIESIEE